MKKNINSNYSLSMFDILEIVFKNITKIILLALGIFLILFLLNKSFNKQTTSYTGTIKIFPTENTYFLNEINRYSKLRNEKRIEFITKQKNDPKSENDRHSESKIKNTDYLTPTRLVWNFTDMVQKKFLKDQNISNVEIKSKSHDYFENHLSYLSINFKFNEFNDEKLDQVNNLLDDAISESKNNIRQFTQNLLDELLILFDLQNKRTLTKISDLKTILESGDKTDKMTTHENISNDTVVIINAEKTEYQKAFNQLDDYCLNKEDLQILETCSNLLVKTQSENLKYILSEINKVKNILELSEFLPIKFLSKDNRIQIQKAISLKYTYLSLLIVSIFITLFYIIILELYKENRKKIK